MNDDNLPEPPSHDLIHGPNPVGGWNSEPTTIGNPDLRVPYTGTSSAEPIPPPPPEGYTLDQWIAERKIRSEHALAAAQEKVAEQMRASRYVIPMDGLSGADPDISTPRPDRWWTPGEYVPPDTPLIPWPVIAILLTLLVCGGIIAFGKFVVG